MIIIRTLEINKKIVEGYFGLLDNLSIKNKLELIAKLTDSVNTDINTNKTRFKKAFGPFDSEKSAEEIIQEIRDSRVFTRNVELF